MSESVIDSSERENISLFDSIVSFVIAAWKRRREEGKMCTINIQNRSITIHDQFNDVIHYGTVTVSTNNDIEPMRYSIYGDRVIKKSSRIHQ